jgi:hypothetical protein
MTSDSDELIPDSVRVPVEDSLDLHSFSGEERAFRKKPFAVFCRDTHGLRVFAKPLPSAGVGARRLCGSSWLRAASGLPRSIDLLLDKRDANVTRFSKNLARASKATG